MKNQYKCLATTNLHCTWPKHIEIDRFYIKEKIEERILYINYIPTTEQGYSISDVLYQMY